MAENFWQGKRVIVTGGAGFLRQTGDRLFDVAADRHHQIGELIDDDHDARQVLVAKAGRLGRELTDACLQYWGGMGFMNETPVSRAYRDSRLTSIGGGAS